MLITFWIGWLILASGLAVILHQHFLKQKARASQSWPTTEGTIYKSEVTVMVFNLFRYRPEVIYNYTVTDRRYKGKNVCLNYDIGTGNMFYAERCCVKYPAGRKVTVYYNPNNPAEACLEQRVDTPRFFIYITAAIMFFGLCMVLGLFD
jgi:hypothetical protein